MTTTSEGRLHVIEDVFAIALEPRERQKLLAQLWDWTADDWGRGVMYGGGIGTIAPERPPNPYRKLELPTKPSVIRATVNGRSGVLLAGPHPSERKSELSTWDEFDNHFHYPDEISSFQVLWTEEA